MFKKIENIILSYVSKEEARITAFKAKLVKIEEYIKSLEEKIEAFRVQNLFK